MFLRKLSLLDSGKMLEWMKDEEVTKYFHNDFSLMTQQDVESYIKKSFTERNQHFAISSDRGEYLGTISLKNIDYSSRNAEYAVVLSHECIGHNVATMATDAILMYAFTELKLEKVYFNVVSQNVRAIKFYKKYGFSYEGKFQQHIMIKNLLADLEWYCIFKDDFLNKDKNYKLLATMVKL